LFKYNKPASLSYSDDWHAYSRLSVKGHHVVIKKDRAKPQAIGTQEGL